MTGDQKIHGFRRGLTNYGDRDFSLYLRRSFASSMGYSRDMLNKPIVGICHSASGFNNCHRHFPEMIEAVKRGVLAAGLQQYLADHGFTLLIGCTYYKDTSAMDQALKMVERGIECVVLVGLSQPPDLLPFLRSRKIPSVITFTSAGAAGAVPEGAKIIGFDNRLAMHEVVDHLLGLGHRSFGCITVTREEQNDRLVHRVDGVKEALARAGIAIRPQHLLEMPQSTIAFGRQALAAILETESPPTAIIGTNDFFALGAIFEAKARNVAVPGQLSIAGFDNLEIGAHIEPTLTTMRVPTTEMGTEVARYIVDLLEGNDPAEPPELAAQLIVRGSTGPAP